MSVITRIFGDASARIKTAYRAMVQKVSNFEAEFEKLSPEDLKAKTIEFRRRVSEGEALDDILPEAFAAVREAAKRTLGQRHFNVQLIGGSVLHEGKIAEMKTGEGKTLVATLPAYLNTLSGKIPGGVHIVTVNDYLSRRDAVWMGQIYHALGISVGVLNHEESFLYDPKHEANEKEDRERDILGSFRVVREFLRPVTRREAYEADITYGTNNEFGFDYLRDNMAYSENDIAQRGHNFVIVDEVDSILIDEARTPLIISAPDVESGELYRIFSRVVINLKESEDYTVDNKFKAVSVTEAGIEKVEKLLGIQNIYTERGIKYVHHMEQALRAKALFILDRDYVVRKGEVIIVDEFTGRLMPGRRWSDGLHQAIEAKEGVEVQKESRTLATITFQNYFRMYKKLAGMTGTAASSAEEFHKVYGLEVVTIPTNREMVRQDYPDRVYQTEKGKFTAVAREIKERTMKGQSVLVGTVSIEKNERLSEILNREGIKHEVLNAKNHEREAEIIAQAGRKGAVTVATNLAGRGVDILLGGNPPDGKEAQEVKAAGGLFVLGTERHEARRIDDQLRGRSGRQGDSGATQFFVSLEDDLMKIFGSERIKNMMGRFGIPEDEPVEARIVSSAIESAQAKIEGFNFDSRKHILEYDDVMNKQRTAVYERRRKLLLGADEEINKFSKDYISKEIKTIAEIYEASPEKDIKLLSDDIKARFGESVDLSWLSDNISADLITEKLEEAASSIFSKKETELGQNFLPTIRQLLLRANDTLWIEHLEAMEYMRSSVRLRAYGQRDPLVEYKNEAIGLFREFESSLRAQFISLVFHANESRTVAPPLPVQEFKLSAAGAKQTKDGHKLGRNDPCFCGSGKKYKKCHGK